LKTASFAVVLIGRGLFLICFRVLAINSEIPRRGAWAVKEKFLPVVREPWGVVRGEGVAIFG
jgi:hypothetical protein